MKELKIKNIKYMGKKRVIDLNVKRNHTFITSNDIPVSNCDYISPNAQAMLRDLMEQVQSITRFIFQCNYSHKIIKEILSRCQIIEINNPPAKEIYQHLTNILTNENINIKNKRVIVDLIKGLYPDIRKMINTLQLNSVGGVINDSISTDSDLYTDILNSMKKQDIEDVRRILRSNTIDYVSLYQHLFDNIGEFKSPGDAILLIGEHLYRDGLIAIKEINFMTMFVLMLKNGSL